MTRALAAAIALLALLPLSGCFGASNGSFDFVPGTKYKETGNTVYLKAQVVDYDSEVYPGLNTWLWAFCFAPVNADDAYSANAIEGWTPLTGDKAVNSTGAALDPAVVGKCSVPGPTLRVKQGDRVKIVFENRHFHPHTIHWHGQFVEWQSDGAPGVTQDSVESGGAYTYDFIAKRAGTLWYHCHVDTQLHVQQGLYGVMIVEPQDDKYEPKGIDREYVIVLSTMNRNTVEAVGKSRHAHPPGCASGFPDCENPPSNVGKPDVFLFNGHSYPFTMDQVESLLVVKEGERVRLRILNAGETFEELHPHGHDMQVVAKDGNPLSKSSRYWVDTLAIGPAERYDVVITADNPGPWMIHTHVSSHETNCGKSPGGMHSMLVYDDYVDKMHQYRAELPAECPPGDVLQLPSDYANLTSVRINRANPLGGQPINPSPPAPVTATWSWPISLACGVRSMSFEARILQDAAVASQTAVTLQLKTPSGAAAENGTLVFDGSEETPTVSYILAKNTLGAIKEAGEWTVDVSGYGVNIDLVMDVFVDYYETFEQSKVGHLTYKVGGCEGFT